MSIQRADRNQLNLIQKIAKQTWPNAFGQILSAEQLEYMMEMMYSLSVLKRQYDEGHEFYLFFEKNLALGFLGVEPNYKNKNQLKIHKLYILPEQQGKKIGEKLIQFAEKRCFELNQTLLTLNVNRYNEKAIGFYLKLRFKNVLSEDIEIGNGYLMEDYVMEKELKPETLIHQKNQNS